MLIDYPKNYQNRFEISYGEPDAAFNRAGRIWLRQDASGGQEFFFDEVGNTVKEIRTLLINEASARTWISEASYDSWGRMNTMIYPDGEQLKYTYLPGGLLEGFYGEKFGRRYDYLQNSRYNEFGELLSREYGNGSGEQYTYAPNTKRLSSLQHTGMSGDLQQWQYTYDNQGNILTANQQIGPNATGVGGASSQTFTYDELHQLETANGDWQLSNDIESYTYAATYGQSYNIESQQLLRTRNGDTLSNRSRNWNYRYDESYPHRLSEVGGRQFTYDHNGNQLSYAGENGSYRYEQNR